MMITLEEAARIAEAEREKREQGSQVKIIFRPKAVLTGKFYSFPYGYYDLATAEEIIPDGGKMEIDIDARTGAVLDLENYLPWNEYGRAIDSGKIIRMPEGYNVRP